MKFICEHCGSKYTIADEKVRSKILKIRCKKCNNIIEVRDPGMAKAIAENPPPKAVEPARSVLENKFAASFRKESAQKPQGTPGLYAAVQRSARVIDQDVADRIHWFVAIDNAPVGPISARKVHDHREAGRIQDATLVWKEGMVDWTPLRNCKELVGLLAHIDLELSESKQNEAHQAPKLGLFEERQTSHEPLKGKSLGNLDDRVDAPQDDFVVPEAPPKNPSEMPQENPSGMLDSDFGVNIEGGVGTLHTLVPPKASGPSQDRVVKIAAIGFFVVAVCTLGVAVLGGDDRVETKTTAGQAVEKVIEKVVFVDRPVPTPPQVAIAESGEEEADDDAQANRARNRRAVKAKAKTKSTNDKKTATDERTQELLKRMGMNTPEGNARLQNRNSRQSSSRGGAGGGALTSNQVKNVVGRNKRGAQSCYERALKQGEAPDDKDLRVDFSLTVGSSGMVKKVLVKGAGPRYPNLARCLKRSVSKWVFPSSSSDSPVEFPIVFTPR